MTKTRKPLFNRLVSLILVLVMMISIVPLANIAAYSATVTLADVGANTPGSQRGFKLINYLQTDSRWRYVKYQNSYMQDSACGILSIVNAVYNVTGNFIYPTKVADWAYSKKYFNQAKKGGGICNNNVFYESDDKFGKEYGFKVVGGGSGNAYSTKLLNHMKSGGTAVIWVVGHYMALVDYNPDTDKYLVFDCAPGKGTDYNSIKRRGLTSPGGDWMTKAQLNSGNIKIQGYFLYSKTGQTEYTVTANTATNVTNNSATISSNISPTASVEKWGYYISKNESEVRNIDAVTNPTQTHEDTSTMDYNRFIYNENPISMSYASCTVDNMFNGRNALQADTTYYYKFCAKVNGKWYQSGVNCFRTTLAVPGSTTLTIAREYSHIGLNKAGIVASWNAADRAQKYHLQILDENEELILGKTVTDIYGTTVACPEDWFSEVGTYYVRLQAINEAGFTYSNTQRIDVHPNVTVTFYDTVTKSVITETEIPYGEDATPPQIPNQKGYTFQKWEGIYTNVKADGTVNAVYKPNVYNVRFINGLTGEVIGTPQKVEYNQKPDVPVTTEYIGYNFVGWDKDFEHIEEDTTITANYQWYDEEFPINLTVPADEVVYNGTNVKSIEQVVKYEGTNKEVTGYNVIARVEAYPDDYVQGRLVVSLKSEQGLLLATTESAAFSLESEAVQFIRVFVPCDTLAHSVAVYCVNSYEKTGIISNVISQEIDNSESWKTTSNADEIPDNAEVIAETHTEKITQYSTRTKQTTTSYETSLDGWTRDGDGEWINQGQQTLEFAEFPSGFNTGNSLYKKYNNSPVPEYFGDNRKVITDHTDHKSYIYWHWCRGENQGSINRSINWSKTSTFDTFHAFESTTKKDYNSSANAYQWKKTGECSDTYWWNGFKTKKDGLVEVKTQYYTEYLKRFNYYRWSDWSDWSEIPQTETWDAQVRTQIVDGETTTTYKYRANNQAAELEVESERIVNLSGSVGSQFANKEAVVFVYKYTQTADYTNEYISDSIVLDANGSFTIENAKLREKPTEVSGDFTIAVSVKGCAESIVVGKIEAPKPVYTVTYYDFDGSIIYQNNQVVEGTTIEEPDTELLHVPVGYKFTTWDTSAVNVQRNLEIRPMSEKETYVIVFVDWASRNVTVDKKKYGETVILPEAEEQLGYTVSWDTSDLQEQTIQENDLETTVYTAYQDAIVTTQYEEAKYELKFISFDSKFANLDIEPVSENDGDVHIEEEEEQNINYAALVQDDDIEETIVVTGGASVVLPYEEDEAEQYIFLGWRSISDGLFFDGNKIKSDGTYYPVYEFAYTVETPVADVTTGEYDAAQTITLSCDTENAVIYYSTDGSDPSYDEVNDDPDDPSGVHEYSEPITLTKSTTLKFCAMAIGMNNSGTIAELYAINTSTSGVRYHLVTVYSNLPQDEGTYYQAIIKDSTKLTTTEFGGITGYTYEGLFYDDEGEDEFYPDSDLISEETVLYAIYTPMQFTATFVDDDGTLLGTSTVDYATAAQAPVPEKEDYVFIGWDSDDYMYLTEDKTFTAQYCPENEYATVSLSRSTMTVVEDSEPRKLKAKVSPAELSDTELVWDTNNPDVVSVDQNGLCEFLSEGSATVTVTVVATGESAECFITVMPNADKSLFLSEGTILDINNQGYLRRIPAGANSVLEIRTNFANDESKLFFYSINGSSLADTGLVGTGTVIKLMDGDTVLDEITAIMTGDFNGDGKIQTRDVSMLSQHVLDLRDASDIQSIAVDVNGDGYVNVRDCAMISRYLAGKEELE